MHLGWIGLAPFWHYGTGDRDRGKDRSIFKVKIKISYEILEQSQSLCASPLDNRVRTMCVVPGLLVLKAFDLMNTSILKTMWLTVL